MTINRTFLLAIVLAAGLTACGDKPAPAPAPEAAQPAPTAAAKAPAPAPMAEAPAAGNTLKKITDTGVIKIGHRDASIPFSYLDDKQQPIGYSVDICLKIADAVKAHLKMPNLKVEFVPVTSQTRIPILTGGNIDIECGSTTNSVERQKQVAFAPTYFVTGTKIVVKKSSGIKGYDDLKGKTVVFTTGTTNERAMKAYNDEKNLGINFVPSKDHAESFLAVDTGRAVAFPMDDILLYSLKASAKNPDDFVVIGEFLSDDPYAVMLRKDDPDFKKLVDDTVSEIYKSGEINNIYTKWFETKIPPKGINLGFPMSDGLKEAIKNPNNTGVGPCGKMKC
jgi:glutamate/aspartate transport system substrate-binding protein